MTMAGIISPIREFLEPEFNRYLVVLILFLGALAFFYSGPQTIQQDVGSGFVVHSFYLPTCPHCAEQKPIINELSVEMNNVSFIMHDASTADGSRLFYTLALESGMDTSNLGVPTTFVGKKPLVGVHSKQEIIDEIAYCQNNCIGQKSEEKGTVQSAATGLKEFDLPFVGRTDLTSISLPMLALVLGLIDGFNPCAMWVLVYLIALLMNVNDKRKFWLIIGTFVISSGILYFLFMTAWLNVFLVIGYMRIVTILIGMVALGGGILSLREYILTKGALTCKVGDESSHKKTMDKINQIISSPLSVGIFFSIVVLAFVVNSVEFVCSSAIPAVFAQILAISNITDLERYAYIALYDFFFMLDDLLVFGLAALAVTAFGEKYAKYCKLIGGLIMLVMGSILLFAPHLLR
jgi:glutaredoxin